MTTADKLGGGMKTPVTVLEACAEGHSSLFLL